MIRSGNIFANLPIRLPREEATILAERPGAMVERIVSTGQASEPGFWYDQNFAEWVIVLTGAAGLRIEGEEATRRLGPGDHVELPPHVRHRIEWTDPDRPTVWLAVHWKDCGSRGAEERATGFSRRSEERRKPPCPRAGQSPAPPSVERRRVPAPPWRKS